MMEFVQKAFDFMLSLVTQYPIFSRFIAVIVIAGSLSVLLGMIAASLLAHAVNCYLYKPHKKTRH
jgi:hypothetical protein